MIFGFFTLFVALVISAVAAYYSIVGLTAIFSAAVIPIIIMGGALEVGKVTAAVWLKMNWSRASVSYKLYLVPAVAFLMLLTSMGIFGFLSKAHSDQSLVSGDSMAKVAIYDEKIKTEKDNIDANRKALKQLDEAVDQVMGRSTDEKGADKAVAIRRGQQAERGRLLKEITQSQQRITALNEERAPLAAEFRKVEAEVGPIKYIAALVYGDNPDASILEKAVRLVIIIIVAVFDPLALVLILAAQQSLRWANEDKDAPPTEEYWQDRTDELLGIYNTNVGEPPTEEEKQEIEEVKPPSKDPHPVGWMFTETPPPGKEKSMLARYPYLTKPFAHFKNTKPMVYTPEPEKVVEPDLHVYDDERLVTNMDKETLTVEDIKNDPEVKEFFERSRAVAQALDAGEPLPVPKKDIRWEPPKKEMYVPPETMEPPPKEVVPIAEAAEARGSKTAIQADNDPQTEHSVKAHFGTEFPVSPEKGEMYLRVDRLPSKLYKYNGAGWIEVDKSLTDSYLYNDEYLKHLVSQIEKGQLDIDDLTDSERGQIEEYLLNAKSNRNAT